MDALVIQGPSRLEGEVSISGSKNAALPLLFASLLFDKEIVYENVPRLWDIETTLKLLEEIGTESGWDKEAGVVRIYPAIRIARAPYEWVRKMRAGILALGPLVAKHGEAEVSLPGGCAIGARPVGFHTDALEKMGVTVAVEGGYIRAKVKDRLRGADITFPQVSVTGTENILMAATRAEGTTILRNAAQEPEVVALGEFLQSAGAEIEGLGTPLIRVRGGDLRPPAQPVRIRPDRIETGTWIAIAAATRSALTLVDTDVRQMQSVIEVFRAMGVGLDVQAQGTRVHVTPAERYRPIDVETQPYPGFATDMQAQLLAALLQADGESRVRETIFENRFMHVAELRRLGAQIEIDGNEARVQGSRLKGAPMMATDLRASASLVVAALAAEGESRISRIYHLDRGYQKLDQKLQRLGAKISRVEE